MCEYVAVLHVVVQQFIVSLRGVDSRLSRKKELRDWSRKLLHFEVTAEATTSSRAQDESREINIQNRDRELPHLSSTLHLPLCVSKSNAANSIRTCKLLSWLFLITYLQFVGSLSCSWCFYFFLEALKS